MPFLKDIQWKALILLTVFTANLYAVCQCHHRSLVQPAVAKSCCAAKHAHQEDPGCPDKNGCRNGQSIKFSLLDKQIVEKLSVNGLSGPAAPAQPFITAPFVQITVLSDGFTNRPRWQYKHAPPDRQSLYQLFLI